MACFAEYDLVLRKRKKPKMAGELSHFLERPGRPPVDPEGNAEAFLLPPETTPSPASVLEALRHILTSEFFRTSLRGKQFLSYIVQYHLEHPAEQLKERTIGAALFNRRADYDTGDDSVVRAQAREVRRRLERYYAAYPHQNPFRILIPVGSYTVSFKWNEVQDKEGAVAPASLAVFPGTVLSPTIPGNAAPLPKSPARPILYSGIAIAVAICAGIVFVLNQRHTDPPPSAIMEFWAPAFASSKPVLICLPQPIFYRPSTDLYKRSASSPGEFDREVDRMNHGPHLKPEDTIHWGDMQEFYEYGVSKGDVQAAVRLSNFIGRQGKTSEVRIGSGYSYEDLRNSSAVMIGAYSNPWTMEMLSSLHFTFAEDNKGLRIQEQNPAGRSWHPSNGTDYGLVTRLRESTTGQFVILAAGVEASGSDAAADLIVNERAMEEALHGAPKDWAQKNVQIVVSTEVKGSTAGPPKVMAIYVW